MPGSGYENRRIVLADGAIRSGKTVAMILSFLLWSLTCFRERDFIMAGVTSGALTRNVLSPMLSMLETLGIPYEWKRGEGKVIIGRNSYYLFGADKDNAQDKLQGMTAAGAYADEAALFPRSFVDQMIGRCSVEGSRIFLNCNPNGAYHFLKTDFIDRADEIGMYRLHFTMDDNLTLPRQSGKATPEAFRAFFTASIYWENGSVPKARSILCGMTWKTRLTNRNAARRNSRSWICAVSALWTTAQ